MVLDLRAAMFARLVRLPARFFDDNSSGALLSKVAYDVAGRHRRGHHACSPCWSGTRSPIVGLLALLFYLNWKLTLIALLIGPPIALHGAPDLAAPAPHVARGAAARIGDLVHVLQETIDCHKVVKVFGGQDYETRRFARAAQAPARLQHARQTCPRRSPRRSRRCSPRSRSRSSSTSRCRSRSPSRATVGEFASFITAMLMLLAPLKHLTEINSAAAARPRRRRERVRPDRRAGRGGPRHGGARRARAASCASRTSRFTYPTRTEPALADIDLHIRPGETVALVGGSGGGKTTLVNLLPRFYAPDAPGASCSTATTCRR